MNDRRTPPGPIGRERLAELTDRELRRFADEHPVSAELFGRGQRSLIGGVPMNWMTRWSSPFPPFLARRTGPASPTRRARVCRFLPGRHRGMTGHGPAPCRPRWHRAQRGITTMLPTEDAIWVAEELARRFGLPYWPLTLSATDANRAALRIARQITRRPKSARLHYCYHGSVDETFACTGQTARPAPAQGNVGPPVDPAQTTVAVEFNDIGRAGAALAHGDVACVLAEPAMTNIGIILPEPGLPPGAARITRATGTLLIIDETHTLSAGPGGCTAAWGLDPDMVTLGKAIGSGVASGALGVSGDALGQIWPRSTRTTRTPAASGDPGRQRALPRGHAGHAGHGAHRQGL